MAERCFLAPPTCPLNSQLQGKDPRRLPSVLISTDVVGHNPSSVVPRKHWKSLLVTGSCGYPVPSVGQSSPSHILKISLGSWEQSCS